MYAECRKGEEITVSYGNHSDEVFFAYFGFLPEDEDYNSATVFYSRSQLRDYVQQNGGMTRSASLNTQPQARQER